MNKKVISQFTLASEIHLRLVEKIC